jgi:hypothetical protein
MHSNQSCADCPPASDAPRAPLRRSGLAVQRLLDDASLQREFDALHECGPYPNALFVAELLDNIGADPATLDAVRTWRSQGGAATCP